MHIRPRAARVLTSARLVIDRYILPMAISVNHVGILLLTHVVADFLTFIGEDRVRMIVFFLLAIWTDNWVWIYQNTESRVLLRKRLEKPLFLGLPPNRFIRTIWSIVPTPIVTPFHHPNL